MLAEAALVVLERECQVVFHARTREDLAKAVELKKEHPEAHAVLASFGVMVPSSVLDVFEPEGILNIHPSLLPLYRGASPIETAILDGRDEFGVSVMKLAKAMDAGPVYWQTSVTSAKIAEMSGAGIDRVTGLVLEKAAIYKVLAEMGAEWIMAHLGSLPEPAEQAGEAIFCRKFVKADGVLTPETDTAEATFRKIVAYQGYPKPKFTFYGHPCTILAAHMAEQGERAVLTIPCADGALVAVDRLQPEGRKAMDAKSFVNGYGKA